MPKRKYPKIPSAARITSKRTYEVVFTDEFLKDDNQMGECRFEPPQIVIKNGLGEKETFKTYIHEVLHAMSWEFEANLTETQVRRLEEGIHRFLVLNKLL